MLDWRRLRPTPTAPPEGAHSVSLNHAWRLVILALLGGAMLVALTEGELPSRSDRHLVSLLCALLGAVALVAMYWRPSALTELTFLDGVICVVLIGGVIVSAQAALLPLAVESQLWFLSLGLVYIAGRVVGPLVVEPALALWVIGLLGLSAVWWAAHLGAPWAAPMRILDPMLLVEQAVGLLVFTVGFFFMRAMRTRRPGLVLRLMLRGVYLLLALAFAGIHLALSTGGDLDSFLHRRALGWNTARGIFWQFPMWGWGGGAWPWAVQSLPDPPTLYEPIVAGTPERLLVAGGVMGFLIILILLAGMMLARPTTRRRSPHEEKLPPLITVAGVLFTWTLTGLWSQAPLRPANLIVLAWATGTALSLRLRLGEGERPIDHRAAKTVGLTFAGVTLFTLLLPILLGAWISRANSVESALGRVTFAQRLMPWDDRWPRRAADIAGLGLMSDPGPESVRLANARQRALDRALWLFPWDAQLHLVASRALLAHGAPHEAEAVLRDGLDRVPLDDGLRLILAAQLESQGETREAYLTLQPLGRLRPTGLTKETMARLAWCLGERRQAERHAREAIQMGHRSPALANLLEQMSVAEEEPPT